MGSSIPPDHYATLGLNKDADAAAVKLAYRKLALRHHPDKVTDPEAKKSANDVFHNIQVAWETLGDEGKRNRYDADVRLHQLTREAFEKRGGRQEARHDSGYQSPTTSRTNNFDNSRPQYTECRPPWAKDPFEDAASRAKARSYDDFSPRSTAPPYDDAPPRGGGRKGPEAERTSRRSAYDSKEKSKTQVRDSSKERERLARNQRNKRADKDTRRNRDEKRANPLDDSGSSSEGNGRSRRTAREGEEGHRRRTRDERVPKEEATVQGQADEHDRNLNDKTFGVYEYMSSHGNRRPSPQRRGSARDYEHARRSDGRPPVTVRRSNTTRGKTGEFVRRPTTRESNGRMPSMNQAYSSPADLQDMMDQPRSNSWQEDPAETEPAPPSFSRSQTMPYRSYSGASEKYPRQSERVNSMPMPGNGPIYEEKYPSYGRKYADDQDRNRDFDRKPMYSRGFTRSPSPDGDYPKSQDRPQKPTLNRFSSTSSTRTSYVVTPSGVEAVDRSRSGRTSSNSQPLYGAIPSPASSRSYRYPLDNGYEFRKVEPNDLRSGISYNSGSRSDKTLGRGGSHRTVPVS